MKIKIGKFDSVTGTVPVLFDHEGVKHHRPVNAVLKVDSGYDAAATKERVAEVARGVERKIDLGAIGNAPPEPDTAPADNAAVPQET